MSRLPESAKFCCRSFQRAAGSSVALRSANVRGISSGPLQSKKEIAEDGHTAAKEEKKKKKRGGGVDPLGEFEDSRTSDEINEMRRRKKIVLEAMQRGCLFDDDHDKISAAPRNVYRNPRAATDRVFRWGLGSKFIAKYGNQKFPVTKARPKSISVRDGYFDPPNSNIRWEELNEAWEVDWWEYNKQHARPFPVKKYGLELAKSEAIKFYQSLQTKLGDEMFGPPSHTSDQPGVRWDGTTGSWTTIYCVKGRPRSRCFAAHTYSYESAKRLAEARGRRYNAVLDSLVAACIPS